MPRKFDDKSMAFNATAGRRIRECWLSLGMNQSELGERVGLTFQQIQKYENGRNACSVPRLSTIAEALDAPLSFFIQDEPEMTADRGGDTSDRETRDLMADYHRLPPHLRAAARRTVRAMAEAWAESGASAAAPRARRHLPAARGRATSPAGPRDRRGLFQNEDETKA